MRLPSVARASRWSTITSVLHLRRALVEVLPEWHAPPIHVWAVFPGRRLMPARTRVFIDMLAATFSEPECRAIERAVREAGISRT